ncbi:inhibitor of growth protein 1-like isoform X2 [Liolophura sinensis]|uniref:inhibitor of growth protein 1-like isoform X2 n=1 Tax=Liolophura sinensis TaxID=3198878 RepID=UPI00315816F8
MSMLNQAAVEALCSATYLENYLDAMENLPDDLQRSVSQLRELDSQCKEVEGPGKKRAFNALQRGLIRCQEIGDDKIQLLAVVIDHIENRTRQLDQDLENLDPSTGKEDKPDEPALQTTVTAKKIEAEKVENKSNKRQRRQKQHDLVIREEDKREEKAPKKKKKRKTKKDKEGDRSPIEPIDPDEPTYCLCDQVSYGEMIGCDNDDCPIEWFHFNCVGLTTKPKGKWFCPKCRGDKPNVKRPDLK